MPQVVSGKPSETWAAMRLWQSQAVFYWQSPLSDTALPTGPGQRDVSAISSSSIVLFHKLND